MKVRIPFIAVVLAIVAVLPPSASAEQEALVVPALRPALYINGGIGKGDVEYMRSVAKDFNLHLTFSEQNDNDFVADVNVSIADAAGNTVFILPGAGPMTNLVLPEGKYRVSALFHGKTETQTVVLKGKEPKELFFHWKGGVRIDPFDGRPMDAK